MIQYVFASVLYDITYATNTIKESKPKKMQISYIILIILYLKLVLGYLITKYQLNQDYINLFTLFDFEANYSF